MYCKYCGKQIDDDAAFCPYCGKAVNGNADVTDSNTDVTIHNYNTNSYAPYSAPYNAPAAKEHNIMAILGIIFSVIGFGSIIMGISGLVCSIIGYRYAVKSNHKSKGLAIAGIAISIVAIIVQVIVLAVEISNNYGYIDGAVYY